MKCFREAKKPCDWQAGIDPEEIFKNRDVFDLNKAYLGGINGTNGFDADGATNALQYDLPSGMTLTEFLRRCEPLVKDLPTVEEGNRRLKAYVEREIASLTERKKVVAVRDQRQLQANLEMATAGTRLIKRGLSGGGTWIRATGPTMPRSGCS